jgi:hypothetical protein
MKIPRTLASYWAVTPQNQRRNAPLLCNAVIRWLELQLQVHIQMLTSQKIPCLFQWVLKSLQHTNLLAASATQTLDKYALEWLASTCSKASVKPRTSHMLAASGRFYASYQFEILIQGS